MRPVRRPPPAIGISWPASVNPIRAKRYREGDHDYDSRYGSREDYKREYRAAFEQGYREGYGAARR